MWVGAYFLGKGQFISGCTTEANNTPPMSNHFQTVVPYETHYINDEC